MSVAENPTLAQNDVLRFLVERIDYERAQSMPRSEEAFKLDRMRELLDRLGNPQYRLRIVHIAGTKGKGSTAAMMAAVLTSAGLSTGLFTSPHLDRLEERIVVDGQTCTEEELAGLLERIRPEVEAMDAQNQAAEPSETSSAAIGPTYFEIITAAALCYFVDRKVDAAVLEVGLGGRLDSTNVCTPAVSIITSISLDHVKQLGETLSAIAAEKAGIIKPDVPVVSGVTVEEAREVIRRVAEQNDSPLRELGVHFDVTYRPPVDFQQSASFGRLKFRNLDSIVDAGPRNYSLGLLGRHQAANAAIVIAAVDALRRQGWTIPESAVALGLAEVRWPARVEVIARRPTVVLDAAHNAASVESLVETLAESFPSSMRRMLVFATTQEKDLPGMLEQLVGRFDEVVFTRYLNNPRSVPPEELLALAQDIARRAHQNWEPALRQSQLSVEPTPADAWMAVQRWATPNDLICISGSFFFAAEMRRQVVSQPIPARLG